MPDHLAVWQQVREQVAWHTVVPHPTTPVSAVRDGFVTFAHATADRGPHRLRRLLSAYDQVRHAVTTGAHLTPDRLAHWNATVLGVPVVAFRRTPAYAKHGRERYGLHADTEHRFAACLPQAADPATPVTARAARAYLDVAFFHPYPDGNARLAALTLQVVLLHGGIQLDELTPVLTTMRRADDAQGAAGLARLVHGIAMATRRRWLRATEPAMTACTSGSAPTDTPAVPAGGNHPACSSILSDGLECAAYAPRRGRSSGWPMEMPWAGRRGSWTSGRSWPPPGRVVRGN